MTLLDTLLALFAGVAVGGLSALFGVGGGVLMVPFMVLVLETSQHVAEGTSLAVIVPTAIAGVVAHRSRGLGSLRTGAWVGIGGIAGAYVGARLALNVQGDTLRIVFAGLIALIGVRLIAQGLRGTATSNEG